MLAFLLLRLLLLLILPLPFPLPLLLLLLLFNLFFNIHTIPEGYSVAWEVRPAQDRRATGPGSGWILEKLREGWSSSRGKEDQKVRAAVKSKDSGVSID